MNLSFGGRLTILAPERGESWAADLSIVASEGKKPSAAVYLTASECRYLATWLNTMADVKPIQAKAEAATNVAYARRLDSFLDLFRWAVKRR